MKNQTLIIKAIFTTVLFALITNQAFSQNVDQIRWKSEKQVRAILGEPLSVSSPVGTHASYSLWKYKRYYIAFSNGRAFHLFDENSLHKFELQENRTVKPEN